MMTNVAIVEDNDNMRQTLREWIDAAPGMTCVCACATGKEALSEIPRREPNVVLMDIHLGGDSGITCTARLKELMPQLQVVMLTVYKDYDLIFQALKAGASGYLLKRSSPQDVLRAIAEVQGGGAPMTGEVARMIVEAFQSPSSADADTAKLTWREQEILALLCEGLSNKEIAARLGIGYETVHTHVKHIYEKLHVRHRAEAIRKYSKSPPAGGSAHSK